MPDANVISFTAAAEEKRCSRTTLYNAAQDGRLNTRDIGGTSAILKDEKWKSFEPEMTESRKRKLNSESN